MQFYTNFGTENVTKIEKDKSDDTLAYEDNAHEVILRTLSYFLKILPWNPAPTMIEPLCLSFYTEPLVIILVESI